VHDRLVVLHRRIAQEVARREVVRSIDDDVVLGEDAVDVLARESLLIADDLHVGVQRFKSLTRRFGLRLADPLGRMQDLALEIGRVNDVRVDNAERADAGGREVEGRG
jgi:hypothetical protein